MTTSHQGPENAVENRTNVRQIDPGSLRDDLGQLLGYLPSHDDLYETGPRRIALIEGETAGFMVVAADVALLTVQAIRIEISDTAEAVMQRMAPPRVYGIVLEGRRVVLIDIEEARTLLVDAGGVSVRTEAIRSITLKPNSSDGFGAVFTMTFDGAGGVEVERGRVIDGGHTHNAIRAAFESALWQVKS